jgi:hypothetical protein
LLNHLDRLLFSRKYLKKKKHSEGEAVTERGRQAKAEGWERRKERDSV